MISYIRSFSQKECHVWEMARHHIIDEASGIEIPRLKTRESNKLVNIHD